MKKLKFLLLASLAIVLLGSCEKKKQFKDMDAEFKTKMVKSSFSISNDAEWPSETEGCNLQTYDLIGGQHIHMGKVSVKTFDGSVFVKYEANEGCLITETHLYFGDVDNDPEVWKNGIPKIGHFTQKWEGSGVSEIVHEVPVLDMDCFDIAAHAVVTCENGGEETAWANCQQVFALKSLVDIGAYNKWGITGEPGTEDGWCSNFKYYSINEALKGPIDLVAYYNGQTIYGEVVLEQAEGVLTFTITSDFGEVYKSYLFVGTVAELEDHGICNYPTFPYNEISPTDEDVMEHIFEIPYYVSCANEFSGNRWGWYVPYCPGECLDD